jgi:hypothetical protein
MQVHLVETVHQLVADLECALDVFKFDQALDLVLVIDGY